MFYLGLILAVIATLAACIGVALLINRLKLADLVRNKAETVNFVPSFQLPQPNFAPPEPPRQNIAEAELAKQRQHSNKRKKR